MANISDRIETVGGKAKKVTIDGNTVEQHSLKELIEADQYIRRQEATDNGKLPFKRFKLKMGSSI